MYLAFGGQIDLNRVRRLARIALFSDEDMQIGLDHPAYVVGWAQDFQADALIPEQEVTMEFSQTLMVAEVDLVERGIAQHRPLSVSLTKGRMRWMRPEGSTKQILAASQNTITPGDLLVRIPAALTSLPGEVVVTLYWRADWVELEVYLAPRGDSSFVLHEASITSGQRGVKGALMQTEYRISDWERFLDPGLTQALSFRVLSAKLDDDSPNGSEEPPRGVREYGTQNPYSASAVFILDEEAAAKAGDNSGEWPLWQ